MTRTKMWCILVLTWGIVLGLGWVLFRLPKWVSLAHKNPAAVMLQFDYKFGPPRKGDVNQGGNVAAVMIHADVRNYNKQSFLFSSDIASDYLQWVDQVQGWSVGPFGPFDHRRIRDLSPFVNTSLVGIAPEDRENAIIDHLKRGGTRDSYGRAIPPEMLKRAADLPGFLMPRPVTTVLFQQRLYFGYALFAGIVTTFLGLIALAVTIHRVVRRKARLFALPKGACIECGYQPNVPGLQACPECNARLGAAGGGARD